MSTAVDENAIAIVGAGLIGRAWAIVFARAGHRVTMYDADAVALTRGASALAGMIDDLGAAGLLDEPAAALRARIRDTPILADALAGVGYVQECVIEDLSAKREVFSQLDRACAPSVILASSTSTFPASQWSRDIPGRARCLVAHPVNPPHLVPLVELSPAPWTDVEVVARTRALHESVGQVPIVVRHEIQGFVLNRLQGALLSEAFRLVEDGCVTVDDLDKTIKDGLGLRWAFMGPFETIDLNAPRGISDYCARYGGPYFEMAQSRPPRAWSEDLVRRIESERREQLPAADLQRRAAWRDRRLMQLLAHKRRAAAIS